MFNWISSAAELVTSAIGEKLSPMVYAGKIMSDKRGKTRVSQVTCFFRRSLSLMQMLWIKKVIKKSLGSFENSESIQKLNFILAVYLVCSSSTFRKQNLCVIPRWRSGSGRVWSEGYQLALRWALFCKVSKQVANLHYAFLHNFFSFFGFKTLACKTFRLKISCSK